MTRLALMLCAACALNDPQPISTAEQAFVGSTRGDPNALTFWWWAGDGAQLRPALECAIERIRNATCLPVDVSFDAHHWVRQKPPESMGGRLGWTTGSWGSTRIALKAPMGPQTNCRVLTHEIAEHVLRRRNDHAGDEQFVLTAQLLEAVCSVQDCRCFVPETQANPVASTQAACLDPFAPPNPEE
jgi:hypothetical protein